MPKTPAAFAVMLIAGLGVATCAAAQSGDTSGAMSAEMQSQTAATEPATASASSSRKTGKAKRPPSTDMNTTGQTPAPTGPETSTDAGDVSDLSGSTGASGVLPAAHAPPGVAPPGGFPDTGGGEAPNVDGGPH